MSDLEFRSKKQNSNEWEDWSTWYSALSDKSFKTWFDYLVEEIPFTSVRTWDKEDVFEWRPEE